MNNRGKIIITLGIAILGLLLFFRAGETKEYNYVMEKKAGITDSQLLGVKDRVDKIYEYFHEMGYEPEKVKFVVADYVKMKKDKYEMVLKADISDFNLMKMIMNYQFTEYLNYGLMYGVMHDIASEKELEFEEIGVFSIDDIEKYWESMYLSYINFLPEVADSEEIRVAKYISVEMIEFIKEEKGEEFLFQLMKDSGNPFKAFRVSDVMNQWMDEMNPKNDYEKAPANEAFNQNPEEDTIEYRAENIKWKVNLKGKDFYLQLFENIYESPQVFYKYMNQNYREINRLEQVFGFNHLEMPELEIEIYPTFKMNAGGYYVKNHEQIYLGEILLFGHEYIHFINDIYKGSTREKVSEEMRACYYSINSEMNRFVLEEFIEPYRIQFDKEVSDGIIPFNPFDEVERYLGRGFKLDDYYLIFIELKINIEYKKEGELPNVKDMSKGYHIKEWVSIMHFIERNYGFDAVDTIMYEDKLPDGRKMSMSDIIKEWEEYIINFSDKDYENYYYVD